MLKWRKTVKAVNVFYINVETSDTRLNRERLSLIINWWRDENWEYNEIKNKNAVVINWFRILLLSLYCDYEKIKADLLIT